MKIAKPLKIQVYSFWITMPFITLAYIAIFYSQTMWHNWQVWAVTYPIIYFIGYFSWRSHVQWDAFITKHYPTLEQTSKRVIYKMLVNIVVMTPSILLIVYVFNYFHLVGYSMKDGDLKYAYLIGLCIDLIFETLWEVVYCIDKYKETVSEREILEQMNLQQQFDNLKEKVNPHFLFNCFNTLSSLISEDKQQAELFLNELSKVYRYLLRNNEDGMTTVESEVKFIRSYFQLLETRYAHGVELKVQIDEQFNTYLLPSLSLQLLVENAVKHNIISRQAPLTIDITTKRPGVLVVCNSLNLKQQKEKSTRIGLRNIRDKYDLLGQGGFEIVKTAKSFSVSLPLILKNNQVAGKLNNL